jgi:hypothetical protein
MTQTYGFTPRGAERHKPTDSLAMFWEAAARRAVERAANNARLRTAHERLRASVQVPTTRNGLPNAGR